MDNRFHSPGSSHPSVAAQDCDLCRSIAPSDLNHFGSGCLTTAPSINWTSAGTSFVPGCLTGLCPTSGLWLEVAWRLPRRQHNLGSPAASEGILETAWGKPSSPRYTHHLSQQLDNILAPVIFNKTSPPISSGAEVATCAALWVIRSNSLVSSCKSVRPSHPRANRTPALRKGTAQLHH